ncbi:MAG: hypothetical protein ACP5LE_00750, partial [Thermoplasmata archaeon]
HYGRLCCLGPGIFCLIWLACFYGIRDLADAYFYGISDVSIPRSLNKIGFYLIALYFFFPFGIYYFFYWQVPLTWVFSYNAIYSFAILLFGCISFLIQLHTNNKKYLKGSILLIALGLFFCVLPYLLLGL